MVKHKAFPSFAKVRPNLYWNQTDCLYLILMEPIRAAEGWFVLHGFYRVNRRLWADLLASQQAEVVSSLEKVLAAFKNADNCQANCYAILGHKADFGIMMIDPELHHLNQTENLILKSFGAGLVDPVGSFFSLTEVSEYMSQDRDYDKTLREKEGLQPGSPEYQKKMEAFRERMSFYINERLYPVLPEHRVMCFYPMNKRRQGADNWYSLELENRKALMSGHLITGRKYAGKVKQLVTGSIGLDQWEWVVTLFGDDPYQFKKIVYEMRYDEVSARYADFGDFLVGIRLDPEPLFQRLRL
jgi:hydrogen peroxide-dependent heme synthase